MQRKGGLAAIAENNHVLSPRRGIQDIEKNRGKIIPARIGLRDASTFPGFCSTHDAQMFKPVEQAGASLDRLNAFLLSFRAIAYEYVMKQLALASYPVQRDNTDCGANFQQQVIAQELLYGRNEGAKRAIADLNRLRIVYGDAYKSGNFADFKVYGITFDSVLPFVASGAFLPEFDFNGNPIQILGTKSEVDEVAFNVTVLENVTVGVFGWWGKPQGPAHRFVDSFVSLPDEAKLTVLAACAFEYLENLYLRESWWNSLSPDEKLSCDDLIHSGMGQERSPAALRNQRVPLPAAKIVATLDCRPKAGSD
ncbi:hypothetical protein IAG25_36270 [Caballeronia sp. EK]|uniref:hypothetical protein n=1 Tax=Caballeronia sp. EK TaxID=2767469 RepID=UPI001655E42C|nr:hypothetical protein [Caballeronia sp. EK]MBC8642259.1 hypothetical protein [Caballeronia sp. EK]